MSNTIADAIIKYKSTISSTFEEQNSNNIFSNETNNYYLKIQIASGSKYLELKPYNFKGLNKLSFSRFGNIYRFFYENTRSFNEAKKYLTKAKKSGFKDAIIVAFNNEKRITIDDFLNLTSN
jgi:N-acetylmuramoyl-L-alanine amidase